MHVAQTPSLALDNFWLLGFIHARAKLGAAGCLRAWVLWEAWPGCGLSLL